MRAALIAAALAALYLVVDPPSADLAAQVYRTGLFERAGFTIWNGAWYSGHHTPGYSLLFPPIAAALDPRVVGALAAVASAWLFDRIATAHFARRDVRVGVAWFAVGTAISLLTGRLTFALGLAVALGAVRAVQRDRLVLACVLGALTALASPVAAMFLALGAGAWLLATRRPAAIALGAATAIPALALALSFPEGGAEPFVPSTFWPAAGALAVAWLLLPREERTLRWYVVLYGALSIAAFVFDTPIGGNATRLAALLAGPLAACMLWGRRPLLLVALALPLTYWQWLAPMRDMARANDDPSIHAGYYAPLLRYLDTRAADGPFRLEIPFTANHWEAAQVAPHVPIARGWERQLDVERNGVFYRGRLTQERYRRWLDANAVRFVALPDVKLDYSGPAEAALVRAGAPWLRPVWHARHWRVYEVAHAKPLATGAARITALDVEGFSLVARRTGDAIVRVRFTPYWAVTAGDACVARAPGGWTRVSVRRPGVIRVGIRFALGRIRATGPRCSR
jgi:hypothetical protein